MNSRSDTPSPLKDRRILIIDGDPASAKLIQAVLEGEGCHLRVASTGKEALIAVLAFRPELILIELAVSDLTGLDLVRLVKGDVSTSATVIVAVTALNGPETRRRALEAGCADYVRKPIAALTFAARLKSLLGQALGSDTTSNRGIDE
ncbi:MAG: pleD 7 [Polyangiaceae bacterium]|jgi:DNA-binding response OmpR family regulator|nr:pleD 7 [Polyangiaceae bacterium]